MLLTNCSRTPPKKENILPYKGNIGDIISFFFGGGGGGGGGGWGGVVLKRVVPGRAV